MGREDARCEMTDGEVGDNVCFFTLGGLDANPTQVCVGQLSPVQPDFVM